jgi:hypothetical protein
VTCTCCAGSTSAREQQLALLYAAGFASYNASFSASGSAASAASSAGLTAFSVAVRGFIHAFAVVHDSTKHVCMLKIVAMPLLQGAAASGNCQAAASAAQSVAVAASQVTRPPLTCYLDRAFNHFACSCCERR